MHITRPNDAASALLTVTRALVGVAARSLPDGAEVTLPQWRALVLVEAAGVLSAGALANQLGVSASTCTRLCDRLVAKGLLSRGTADESRREVALRLSEEGRAMVVSATSRRRAELEDWLDRLSPRQRQALASALRPLIEVAGRGPDDAWQLGWAEGGR